MLNFLSNNFIFFEIESFLELLQEFTYYEYKITINELFLKINQTQNMRIVTKNMSAYIDNLYKFNILNIYIEKSV